MSLNNHFTLNNHSTTPGDYSQRRRFSKINKKSLAASLATFVDENKENIAPQAELADLKFKHCRK